MSQKRFVATLAVTAVVALAVGPGRADAQVIGRGPSGGPSVFTGPGGPVALTPGYTTAATAVYATAVPAAYASGYSGVGSYTPPYSYYAAIPPMPARIYVGYGDTDEFPFYGRPYGHVYDRWSWASMSNYNQGVLARYYYPPVR
jgi:hypothetical protein